MTTLKSQSSVAAPVTERQPGFVAGLRASWPIWLGSRIMVALLSLGAGRTLGSNAGRDVPGFVQLWDRWDVGLYTKVARDGYLSPKYPERTEVDFPGLPLILRAVHVIVPNWVVAGLLVSLVAGFASSAALWSLAAGDTPADRFAGTKAVIALVVFPYAVFLFAGYSEGLFLAGASCAWLAARQRRWALAGVCACLATSSRILGVALIAGLLVQYLMTERRVRASAAWLALPVLPIIGYFTYLWVRTGHWDAYTRGESYWHRASAWPWQGLTTTWRAALDSGQGSAYQVFWWAEIVAGLVGVVLAVILLREPMGRGDAGRAFHLDSDQFVVLGRRCASDSGGVSALPVAVAPSPRVDGIRGASDPVDGGVRCRVHPGELGGLAISTTAGVEIRRHGRG
jgi:hypothetical protein